MELQSKYFTLPEFLVSETAARKGISNEPTDEHLANLQALCDHILDPFRESLGKPIHVNSGYRSPALNAEVGGVSSSQHCFGQAADITVPGMSVDAVVELLRGSGLPYDQLIHEFGSWTHVSFDPTKNRRQVLKATTVNGKTQYSSF